VFGSLCIGCVLAVLKILERKIKIEVFIREEKGQALPANFGKRVG
jgi:hypothetical protein